MKNRPEGNKDGWVWQLTFGEIHKALNSCQSNILKMTIAGNNRNRICENRKTFKL